MNRPCLGYEGHRCGAVISASRRRCVECQRAWDRQRRPSKYRRYGAGWQSLSRAVRAAQPYCQRCGATAAERLLHVDHVEPGSLTAGVRVLCVRCHGSVGARRDRQGGGPT